MSPRRLPALDAEPDVFVGSVVERLARGRSVRRSVPGGWLHIERELPYLFVHRRPSGGAVAGIEQLVHSQASYLIVDGTDRLDPAVRRLVTAIAECGARTCGAFLVVEVWPDEGPHAFLVAAPPTEPASTVKVLAESLLEVDVLGRGASVTLEDDPTPGAPGLAPLLTEAQQRACGTLLVGLAVPTFFVDAEGRSLPLVLRRLQHELARALQRTAFEFLSVQTNVALKDFRALGQRRLLAGTKQADQRLAEVATAVDFLLAVTPVDHDVAWADFQDARCDVEPEFHYRPLDVDPDLLKRALHEVPVEDVQDPTLAALFRAKRRELDRQINLLEDRGTDAFLQTSIQLYGTVDRELLATAHALLAQVRAMDPSSADDDVDSLGADGFREVVAREIARYRANAPDLDTTVTVRDDIPGVLVSKGHVLIGSDLRVPAGRADALVQHEVGTHVVTAVNGRAQPLQLFAVGLPGYDETQEALALLAEFVAGGLMPQRLETIAARAVAVHVMTDGATFVETFRELRDRWDVAAPKAFQTAMRVHRGGGLTKDLVYLRGLERLLHYLRDGNELEPLLLGKLALEHVPVIQELRWREVLEPARLSPRWLTRPESAERVAIACSGVTVLDLVREVTA